MEYTKENIKEVLANDVSDDDLKEINNKFCEENSWSDYVYEMSEFDDIFAGSEPGDIADMLDGADFNRDDLYFKTDDLGNVVSGNDVASLIGDEALGDIAGYLEENQETYGVSELEDLLDASMEAENELD